MNDPYVDLIKIMRDEGAKLNVQSFYIGRVKSVSPFLVELNDITLRQNQLMIDKLLLDSLRHEKIACLNVDNCSSNCKSYCLKNKSYQEDVLSIESTVLMTKIGKKYMILSEVVEL